MPTTTRAATAVAALAAAALALPLAAPADAATVSAPLASGFVGPLQIAVGSDGAVLVAQSFTGTLSRVDKGRTTTVTSLPGGEIAGVDAQGRGTTVYTYSEGVTETTPATSAGLARVLPNGRTSRLADLLTYEQTKNPDAGSSYGFRDLPSGCSAQLPPFVPGDPYDGLVDTHPYAVATVPGGWVVADAAGNDLLRVSPNGSISTLTVLPPQPVVVTEDAAAELGLPECAVGSTYDAEPVPTDVEVGPGGQLYVSVLAGDPAPGAVYRVDPRTGAATLLARGFAAATNLAVSPSGTVYVAELFGGQISKIVGGSIVPVVSVPFPAAVEYAGGKLYASTDVFAGFGPDGPVPGPGNIVTITP